MPVMLWVVFCCALMVLYMVNMSKQRRLVKRSGLPESQTMKFPLLGHSVNFIGNGEDRMNYLQKLGQEAIEGNGILSFWLMTDLCVLVSDPVIAEYLMKTCLDKSRYIKSARALLGYGSIFAPVEHWRPRRKFILPIFTTRNLNQFLKSFGKYSSAMANSLNSQVGTGSFSLWPYLMSYTFGTICESTLGVEVNSVSNHPFVKAMSRAGDLVTERIVSPWLHSEFVYQLSSNCKEVEKCKSIFYPFVDEIIQNKKRELEEKSKKIASNNDKTQSEETVKSFTELLLESSSSMSDLELREELLVIIIGASESTAVGAAFCLLLLAAHPKIQDKVYNEILELIGDDDRTPTPDELSRLKYLECVIKEALRLYPSGPFILREAGTNVILPTGQVVPKNTAIILNLWSINRNPKYWGDDVETFRPERFLEPLTHPSQYMAFSYGPRNCIGTRYAMLSLKAVLINILRRYVVKPAATSPYNQWKEDYRPMRLKFDILVKDVDNFQVQLEKRN